MKNSKRNLARRQRESAARLDPRWQPVTTQPVLASGNVGYEVAGRTSAICWGGLGMLQTVAKRLGLPAFIDEDLHLLKRHKPYHESDHVMSLVYNVLSGGRCLEDLELRRRDPAFLDALGAHRLPDPTTSGDFLRRFGEQDVKALMASIQRVRAGVWQARPKAKRKLEAAGCHNVGYSAHDASLPMPFADDAFDLAVLVAVLGEIASPEDFLREIHRVLRPEGVLAVHEHVPDPDRIPLPALRPLVEASGLRFRHSAGPRWNYTAIFEHPTSATGSARDLSKRSDL